MAYPYYAQAHFGFAVASGQGIQAIKPYRLALNWDPGPLWRPQGQWGLHAIWESSIGFWNGPRLASLSAHQPSNLSAYTTGPQFRWQRQKPYANGAMPYIELGAGLSWLSETQIQGRILSLHFQFEDKFGLGFRFGPKQQYDFALRAYHYSNCSIKRPNSGVNLAMASFGIWFAE
jgi:lipid A 3-O-deacylase